MYLCNFLHTYCVPTRKTNSPAEAVWFAVAFLVVTMMKQNMSYIYLVIHFIVCNIVAYFIRLAVFVVVNIRKDIYFRGKIGRHD